MPEDRKRSINITIFKNEKRLVQKIIEALGCWAHLQSYSQKEEIILQTGINEAQVFRIDRSIIYTIFISGKIAEKSIDYNKPAFICFIDLSKALYRVKCDVLKLLKNRNLNSNTIEIIRKTTIGNNTFIKANNKPSKNIPLSTGIRQGDSVSPILFNVLMDKIWIRKIYRIRISKGVRKNLEQYDSLSDDDLQYKRRTYFKYLSFNISSNSNLKEEFGHKQWRQLGYLDIFGI